LPALEKLVLPTPTDGTPTLVVDFAILEHALTGFSAAWLTESAATIVPLLMLETEPRSEANVLF